MFDKHAFIYKKRGGGAELEEYQIGKKRPMGLQW